MSTEDDDKLTELLADEGRVRDALLAAVDGQLVPPVRTDLVDIVQRGKRRARLQVVGASVAAVVLIAAVALGATVLGRLGGTQRVDTAGQGSSPLPVTSQTITTTSNPPVPSGYYADARCVYPGLDGVKWLPLNTNVAAQFVADVGTLGRGPVQQVTPEIGQAVLPQAQGSTVSAKLTANGQTTLITLSTSIYSGSQTMAAEQDSRQTDMPGTCIGTIVRSQLGKAMVNEYLPLSPKSPTTGPMYLRAQLYSSDGIRYDVTEVVNADSLIQYSGAPESVPSANANTPEMGGWTVAPVSVDELAQFAFQVATMQ